MYKLNFIFTITKCKIVPTTSFSYELCTVDHGR